MGQPDEPERHTTMKTSLEAQTVVELPTREMLGFTFTKVVVNQGNLNVQGGFLNIQGGQANYAGVLVVND
jgi:hypothetical protein